MDYRLTRHSRILKPNDYKSVFNTGQMEKGQYWSVIAKPNNLTVPRIGLAISKKVCRLAVDRNRLKRVARETFRSSKNNLGSWEFVVLSRKHRPASNSVLSSDLRMLLQRFCKT
jgi:ribonuclease P protein component